MVRLATDLSKTPDQGFDPLVGRVTRLVVGDDLAEPFGVDVDRDRGIRRDGERDTQLARFRREREKRCVLAT